MIIIDIGACVGLFIDDCIEGYGIENIEAIYAFEPHKVNADFLVKKYETNDKIQIHPLAISNFAGSAPFYKKWYNDKNGKSRGYDFAGNAGSSLKGEKTNVSNVYDLVEVMRISEFIQEQGLEKIDILKIDSEGSEYDILEDIIENGIHTKIDKIYFEDHLRKVGSIRTKREKVMGLVDSLGIQDKFYEQSDHLEYAPLEKKEP